ncbi:MAG: conjugal transfer protein TrbE [Coxiellaceae bacterium]|jgi:type IV secretion system protein VirB4|nr:conjugal transfer protein TrbE [Coxiellaceae bacterium]
MFNISEYRQSLDRLTDLLPWAALVAQGVVLNKDGSFQRTIRFRGSDLESATEAQLVTAAARLNNVLKRLGSGWALYIEAKRKFYDAYPEKYFFPDPLSILIEAERREKFLAWRESFESRYYLTLQFLPSPETTSKISNLITSEEKNVAEDYTKSLELFIATTQRMCDILQDFMYEAEFLDDNETLTYLHSTISPKQHQVIKSEIPMYLDAFLADTPLLGGIAPKLGDYHLRTVTILSFPASTTPALLDQLNQLPICYRFVTRFIPLDKQDAEIELKRYKRLWFAKRKGLFNLLQEIFTKTESPLLDTAAVEKARDADSALKELAEDYVSFGYYTATITVIDKDLQKTNEMQREIERVINGLGFTTIAETFNAVEAWLSSLPGHAYANVRMPLLHTLNLAHLMPFSAIWPGPENDAHLKAPPLIYVHTQGRTPFRLVNHVGDVGHQMIIGPTGSGKSVLLTLMALQFRRYKDAQIFIFDKGGSFLASTAGIGGGYYELGTNSQVSLVFQPLANIDQDSERIWASEWIHGLLTNEKIIVTPDIKQAIWEALTSLANMPEHQRTITGLSALVQNNVLRKALLNYTLRGPFGHILDADHEQKCDEIWQCYETEELMNTPSIIAPVLSYLFHRLEKRFTGIPTLLVLDEAWIYLDHPIFSAKIHDWLKTLRKFNVSVVFSTQSIEDAFNTNITQILFESCPSRILLPNDRILEPNIRASYEKLGLNERQLQILATATPKQQYYYQSRLGNRLFDVELGPLAMAFCAANRIEDKISIKELLAKHGREKFLPEYLKVKNLMWALELYHLHF